ncbi:MAG: hypothetical protein A3F11_04310 [Gammaproteobacteria bacterium RIFCSPHIGHO2_12_FULL_37_14]|nr:MAG: hypothetical protein A3F11_04310 [Gammaproteobacteria bacterium RIFCSPHIGHO2_12_FULL_37_14]
MNNFNLSIAEDYYTAMAAKNVSAMEKYLHPDVELIAPLADAIGKKALLESITKAISIFNALTIRAKFSSGDQAMLAYDVNFPAPIGNVSSAVLMTFHDKLILKIELFYDARQVEKVWKN